ncbi:MAG: NAD-dependent epimerase/dehydratase family protein [Phycisphaerae bacterium]|nr:NAD-dependent epimerase/dehydratase family protein [Phycisphaerae bacterium]
MNLVTGATGLLGSHIVEQLRKRGRPVRVLVRPGSDIEWLKGQDVEFIEGDLNDKASLRRACEGAECVYHSAARVGDWGPWEDFVRITIEGTANLIDAATTAGVKRFVHISSISVYGHVDGEGLVLDERAPLGAKLYKWAYYSRAKVAAENLVWAAHREGRIRATVIRPSWLYGPRDRASIGRLVAAAREGKTKLIGAGDNRLNVVYAGNVAEAAIVAADSERAIGEAYNCSNDGVLTQEQYFNMIAAALGEPPVKKRVPYRIAHTAALILECIGHLFKLKKPPIVTRYAVWLIGRRCFFETKKAREHLGWQPTVRYEDGIPMTVQWYLQACGERPQPSAASA